MAEVEACLVVEAAASVAFKVVVARVVEGLHAQEAHAPWHAFALRATVRRQTAVLVFNAGVPYVRLQHLKAVFGLTSAEGQTQR